MELNADVIQGLVSSLLQKEFDEATESPKCHYEWWQYFCSNHSQVAISAPRGHAKTTALTQAFTIACMLFRERQYALIVADTISQSTQFLGEIKRTFSDNDRLKELFQIDGFTKDTEDDVIVRCKDGYEFRIAAKGSEQKLRGLKWNNKRPDLIVGDDLENDEIVMNPERREKFKRWFYGALLPSKSASGIVRVVGTILHEDSFLNNLMPKEYDKYTVTEELKTYSDKKGPWLSVKYRAHNEDFSKILWPERYSKEWFLSKKADFLEQGLPDVYSQEFLNEPIDDSVAMFKKGDFLAMKEDERRAKMHHYISVDLAISQKETADYSVFLVAGMDENRMLYVKNVIRERLDGREIVDTLLSLQRVYNPEAIGIEEMQVSKAIGPFLREEMHRTGVFLNLIPLKHGGKDKIQRARTIQARMRARGVKFDKSGDWYHMFEDEVSKFPRSRKDDQVDAFSYLGMMLDYLVEAPNKQEIEEEEYLDELRNSGSGFDGRNELTGY